MRTEHVIDPIEDAIEFLHSESLCRHQEPWTQAEMAELRAATRRKGAPDCAADIYRAMVCQAKGWSYRAGAADCNQVETWRASYNG